jgi:hypothetical protein
MGFRSRQEIDREKFALKTLRGDFGNSFAETNEDDETAARVEAAFRAVRM